MKTCNELIYGLMAGYSLFYCESQEVQKTTEDIKALIEARFPTNGSPENETGYHVKTWDFE